MPHTPHLAKRVENVTPSLTLAIEAKAKQLKQQGADIISLSAGEPDFDTPEPIKLAAIRALNGGVTKYTPASGTNELKDAICQKLARDNHLTYQPDQIVVSCGAKHALYNVLQVLLDEGDEVIIPSPYWLSYPEMTVLAGGVPRFLKTELKNGFQFTARDLEKRMTPRTRVLILNSPSNPTGAVFSKQLLLEIAALARKHSFYILSDEIYEKLLYGGAEHFSIGALDEEVRERVITINGASKSYAMTGWRLGFLAAPKRIALACASLQSHSTSNPTSFAQAGYVEALRSGEVHIKAMRECFEVRRDLIYNRVQSMPKLKAFKPQGAFYLFADISGTGLKSLEFSNRLLDEAKVAVVPGVAFGDDDAIRMSFAASEHQIESACGRIREWLKKI